MKKIAVLIVVTFALLCSLFVMESCSSKPKEDTSDAASADASTKAADEAAAKKQAAAEKRARIEKARAERLEQRRIAEAEMVKKSNTYKDASGKTVYIKVENDPTFTGGVDAMTKYLQQNLKYPQDAVDKGIESTVFVEFVVTSQGNIREVNAAEVVKDGEDDDQSMKAEAIRVVSSMPTWVAGRNHGKNVDTKMSIPITFDLATN